MRRTDECKNEIANREITCVDQIRHVLVLDALKSRLGMFHAIQRDSI